MNNQSHTWIPALLLAACMAVLSGCQKSGAPADPASASATGGDIVSAKQLTVAVMPKLIGIDYFNSVAEGAHEAGRELGVNVVYDGPIDGDSAKQSQMLDSWIARKYDVIAISPNDAAAIAPALNKARSRGIHVITYDADALPEARSYFVNQATNESVGAGLIDVIAEQIGGKGEVVVITGSMTAANQNAWIDAMRAHMADRYPEMQIVDVRPSEVDADLAYNVTKNVLKARPDVKGVVAITSIALPQAARAVEDLGLVGKVAVTGLATPSAMKPFVENGTVKAFLLWSPVDLGYLTVYTAKAVAEQEKLPQQIKAGRLSDIQVSGTEVLLGPPTRFTRENIGDYNF